MAWHLPAAGFTASYFYQLYLHNEYYAEPPGFPSKFLTEPIISSFSGCGPDWKEKRLAAGVVTALRLVKDHTWVEFITAFGKERVHLKQDSQIIKKSRSGADDFLIDFGHNFLDKTGKKQLLLHWLIGIPLTKKISLSEINQPLWGTRTYATGPTIEFCYDFVRNEAHDIFIGLITRLLHFFGRHYEPILPANALLHPGNSLDILALFHYRYYGQNFECGYVYTHFNKASYQFIDHTQKLPSQNYNSFYVDYFYYHQKLSMGFECNITKNFGKPYDGVTVYGLVAWYF